MKILHWPTRYPDPEYGLPYDLIFIQEHVQSIANNFEQVVFYLSPEPARIGRLFDIRKSQENGVQVIRIHVKKVSSEFFQKMLVYCVILKELFLLWGSGFYPDLIHIHIFTAGKIPTFIAKFLRIPTVVTEHWSALCQEGKLSHQRLLQARKVYENASVILPVSRNLYDCIREKTGKEYPVQIIHNAVNESIFYHKSGERALASNPFSLLTVARLEEAKDIRTLIRAVEILKSKNCDCRLDIIGQGDQMPLLALCDQLGVRSNVVFWGPQPKQVIADLMRKADVFVLSSLWENSPCVIGEAFCCGLPVVATAVGGVPELIDSPSLGRLVPPKDPHALADAICDVLEHLESFNKANISKVGYERFSSQKIGEQLARVYHEVIQNYRHGA